MNRQVILQIIRHKKALTILFLVMMGVLYYFPRFVMTGIPHYFYEDTWFHLNRLIGLRNVWQSPVNFLNFAGNGNPVNIFYPWLTMYPMYLIYRIIGNYVLAYKIFYLLLTILTLLGAYYVMRDISGSAFSAIVFAVLYTYCSYRFINLFRRAHIGESIAMTGLLFVLFGLYHISFGDRKRWGMLAFGMTVIAYSHLLSLLIASLLVGLYVMISVWSWSSPKERFLSLCKAAECTVLFSLALFVPILEYSHSNEIYTPGASVSILADTAHSLRDIIFSSLKNEPTAYAVGFLVIMALICLAFFYLVHFFRKECVKTNRAIDSFAVLGLLLFLTASSLLPWRMIGEHTPLRMIQYVWRLNAITSLCILAAFSYYLPCCLRNGKMQVIFTVLLCVFSIGLHYTGILKLHAEEYGRILEKDIETTAMPVYDYAPVQSKTYRSSHNGYTMVDDASLDGADIRLEPEISSDGSVISFVIDAPDSDKELLDADLPVFWYRSQRCTVNGVAAETVMSERGATLVKTASGERSVVSLNYSHSMLTYLSWGISALSAVIFVCCHRGKRRKNDSITEDGKE